MNYFKKHEKSKQMIGAEFEHLILDDDGNWTPYEEIRKILEELSNDLWEKTYVDGQLLGLKHAEMEVTLEPGSQFEISIKPKETLAEIRDDYKVFLDHVQPVLRKHKKHLVSMGLQPKATAEEISIIPKRRYQVMNEYFKTSGTMGHRMMRASAATQVSIDYSSEEDFRCKLQLANRLAPYLSLMFDNVPLEAGEIASRYMIRPTIWSNTDKLRSNVLPGGLKDDLSYEDVVKAYLELEPIVMPDKDGVMQAVGHKKAKEFLDEVDPEVFWPHVLSMGFYDVRPKSYLEIRMIDALPYPYSMSVLALIKGIFYAPDLKEFSEEFRASEAEIEALKERFAKEGISAQTHEKIKRIFHFGLEHLPEAERKYLEAMRHPVMTGETISDMARTVYMGKGMKGLIEFEESRL